MSEPFIAEIKIFAGNFAPRGFAFCDGQLLEIVQNTALFSLVGTTYGGDGRTTLGLPDLRGRAPMHPGNGPGLSSRRLGQHGGSQTVTLTEAQMPSHNHGADGGATVEASDDAATSGDPDGRFLAVTSGRSQRIYRDVGTPVDSSTATGGGLPHANRQPYLGLNFIIALIGLYPSRS